MNTPAKRPTSTPLTAKSSVEEIRERFDDDVERFSNLETGQVATIDASLAMELITAAAARATPRIDRVLDVGCGAGNNTLMLMQQAGSFHADLLDLSEPMLKRAEERVKAAGAKGVRTIQKDIRSFEMSPESYDVVLGAAVFHHLRDEEEWRETFAAIHQALRPGGSLWITDLVEHESAEVSDLMWARYGDYLSGLKGDDYRDEVFAYIAKEDSPRPVTFQLDILREVGFSKVDILHKNSCFAAFGAVKSGAKAG